MARLITIFIVAGILGGLASWTIQHFVDNKAIAFVLTLPVCLGIGTTFGLLASRKRL